MVEPCISGKLVVAAFFQPRITGREYVQPVVTAVVQCRADFTRFPRPAPAALFTVTGDQRPPMRLNDITPVGSRIEVIPCSITLASLNRIIGILASLRHRNSIELAS